MEHLLVFAFKVIAPVLKMIPPLYKWLAKKMNPLNREAISIHEEYTTIQGYNTEVNRVDNFNAVVVLRNNSGYDLEIDEMKLEYLGSGNPAFCTREKLWGARISHRSECRQWFKKPLNQSEVGEIRRLLSIESQQLRVRVTVYYETLFGKSSIVLEYVPRKKPYEN